MSQLDLHITFVTGLKAESKSKYRNTYLCRKNWKEPKVKNIQQFKFEFKKIFPASQQFVFSSLYLLKITSFIRNKSWSKDLTYS